MVICKNKMRDDGKGPVFYQNCHTGYRHQRINTRGEIIFRIIMDDKNEITKVNSELGPVKQKKKRFYVLFHFLGAYFKPV